jgi:uncharacterized PurR-regulated membrane protein YhhQ (DUF165 family)
VNVSPNPSTKPGQLQLLVLGTTRVIDLGAVIARVVPDVSLPAPLQMPFGVLPAAFGVFAVLLACELYGRRRAAVLLWVGAFAGLGLIGLARLADLLDGNDTTLLPTAALAAGALAAHVIGLVAFAALRRRLAGRYPVARALLASLIAQPLGWMAFAGVLYVAQGEHVIEAVTAVGLGTSVYTLACMLALAVPFAIAVRTLSLYLRVARFEDTSGARILPPALIVEDEPEVGARPPRARRASLEPFSSAEMHFFTEGDQLESSFD